VSLWRIKKLKGLFRHSNNRQIWRILLTELGSLVIEERDIMLREVFFSCIDRVDGKKFWNDRKFMNEEFWIGIETVYQDMLILHLFEKPDMPKHKQIIGVDLKNGEVKWFNKDLTFDSIHEGKILAYIQKFESRDFYELDFRTGEVLNSLGNNMSQINEIRKAVRDNIHESVLFPFAMSDEDNHSKFNQIVLRIIGDTKYTGNIEYIEYENLFLFNYYERNREASLTNRLCVVDRSSQEILLKETLNSSSPAPVPDSFFIQDDILYFIRDKKELVAYSLKN
jgi:hypothetical protein